MIRLDQGFGFVTLGAGLDPFVYFSALRHAGLTDHADRQETTYKLVTDKRSGKRSVDQIELL